MNLDGIVKTKGRLRARGIERFYCKSVCCVHVGRSLSTGVGKRSPSFDLVSVMDY